MQDRSIPTSPRARGAIAIGAVLVIAVAVAAWPRPGQAQVGEPPPALLTFTGSGSAQIEPDTATLHVGVRASGASADEALGEASERMRGLIDHMKDQGLDDEQLQTTEVSTYQDHERTRRWWATQSLSITLDDPARAGKLLAEATNAGADMVHGPAFGLDDQRAGYDEALRQAIADARAKADAAAAHMGAEVDRVVTIRESGGASGPIMEATPRDAGSDEVPVEQGTQTVSMTVEVAFSYRR